MAGTAWKSQDRQRSDAPARKAEEQKNAARAASPSRQAALVQALLAGVSPEYLPGLMRQDGAGLPNSVLLDLLDRQNVFREMPVRPLPEGEPDTVPFLWFGPVESPETGGADALPAPLGAVGGAES